MENFTDSDAAMLANNNFESILSSVRDSCLNYSIHISPFSATISLRKTIAKDKTGAYITPRQCKSENSDLVRKVSLLEDKLTNLDMKYEEALSARESEFEKNTFLQKEIKQRDNIIADLIEKNIEAEK